MKNLTELPQISQSKGQLTPWEEIQALREQMYAEENTSFRRLNSDEDLFEQDYD